MRRVAFLPKAFEDVYWWATQDRQIHARITELIKDIDRQPFSGLGKPEPLKHELRGSGPGESLTNIVWFTR